MNNKLRNKNDFQILGMGLHFIAPDILGGGDRVFVELFKKWHERGIRVTILTSPEGKELAQKYNLASIKYELIKKSIFDKSSYLFMIPINYLMRGVKGIFAIRKFRKKIGNDDFIVVHTPGDFICNVIPACFARIFFRKIIWITHIYFVIPPPLKRKFSLIIDSCSFLLQRTSFLLIRMFADSVIVVNSYVKEELKRQKFPAAKIYRSNCGIDLKSIEKSSKLENDVFDACFVGRIHTGKGILDLVEIWSQVVKERKNARLAIVGNGSPTFLNHLWGKIREYGIDKNIVFLGFLASPYSVMKSSKLLLYPDHEAGYGWGVAVCEALSCGALAIAYDLPVYKEIYRDNIILVEHKNNREFARQAVYFLNNDKERLAFTGEAREYVKRYDWGLIADDLLIFITGLVN